MPVPFDLAGLGIGDDSEYLKLLERCPDIRLARYDDGEYLTREGDSTREIFIILKGACVVEVNTVRRGGRAPNALATVLSDLRNPSFVGEMAYLGGGFRSASVRASGGTFAFVLKPAHLDILMAEFPLFTRILCRQFAARLAEANGALRECQEQRAIDISGG